MTRTRVTFRTRLRRIAGAIGIAATVAIIALAALVVGRGGIGPAKARDTTIGPLRIGQPWARATVGMSRPGGAYLTIANTGTAPDRLIGAESPVAARVELHRSRTDGGVMRMLPVDAVTVPAGAEVKFAPGGYHLMLMGLKQPLAAATRFPLTLVFEKAGRVAVAVAVRPLGGKGAGHGGDMNMKGMGR